MVLRAVEEKDAYANLALNQLLERHRLEKVERAFATQLTYGVLRTRNTLDWILSHFTKKPLKSQTILLRNILRLGVYQLLYMDKVPPSAACNEGAEMARRYGHQGAVKFVNGVLRNVARRGGEIGFPSIEEDPVKHIVLRYSHPQWIVKDWLDSFGQEETLAICMANNEAAPTTIRTNTLRLTRDELKERLCREGVTVRETAFASEGLVIDDYFSIDRINAFKEGLFQVQDESSMLAGRALCPDIGAKVLDACSAPGGKTTHLAELMGNKGEILAADPYPHKISLIEDNCRRLGIEIVRTMAADASRLTDDLEEWADYALVDAPCTGLGVLRRRPDARWRKEESQPVTIAELQRSILDGVSRCLKPGGVLVYSTCTITHQENLGQVKDFLNRHREFYLESLSPYLPSELESTGRGSLSSGYFQILPGIYGMDGFFICRMRKKSGH